MHNHTLNVSDNSNLSIADNDTLADIIELGKPLEDTRNLVVGSTAVLLDGERSMCRLRECNAGKAAKYW